MLWASLPVASLPVKWEVHPCRRSGMCCKKAPQCLILHTCACFWGKYFYSIIWSFVISTIFSGNSEMIFREKSLCESKSSSAWAGWSLRPQLPVQAKLNIYDQWKLAKREERELGQTQTILLCRHVPPTMEWTSCCRTQLTFGESLSGWGCPLAGQNTAVV